MTDTSTSVLNLQSFADEIAARMQRDEPEQASAYVEGTIERHPNKRSLRLKAADHYLMRAEHAYDVEKDQMAGDAFSEKAFHHMVYASDLNEACPATEKKPSYAARTARMSLRLRHLDAVKYNQRLVRLVSKDPYAWFNLGLAFNQRRDRNVAVVCLQNALRLDSAHAPSLSKLADWRRSIQVQGEMDLSPLNEVDENSFDLSYFRDHVFSLKRMGKWAEAQAYVEQMLALYGDNPQMQKQAGHWYSERADAAHEWNDHPQSERLRGKAMEHFGRASDLNQALPKERRQFPLALDAAIMSIKLKHADAVKYNARTVELEPNNAKAWCDLGDAYDLRYQAERNLQDKRNAVISVKNAFRLKDDYAPAIRKLAKWGVSTPVAGPVEMLPILAAA